MLALIFMQIHSFSFYKKAHYRHPFWAHVSSFVARIIWVLAPVTCFTTGDTENCKMSLCMRKPTIWVSDQVDTNRPVQSQKQARFLKRRKKRDCTIHVAKTKALISFAVTAKLICVFVFAYADCWFSYAVSYAVAQIQISHDLKEQLLNTTKSSTIIIVFTSIKSCDQKRF